VFGGPEPLHRYNPRTTEGFSSSSRYKSVTEELRDVTSTDLLQREPGSRLVERPGVLSKTPLEAATNVGAECEDGRVRDPVDGLESVPATGKDACLGKGLELAGDVGLGKAGCAHQFRDVLFAGFKRVDELEPAGFAKHAKAGGDHFERVIGQLADGGFFGHK
jgi:hypothetical protein